VKTTRSASDDRNVQHLLGCVFQMRTGRVHYKGDWDAQLIRVAKVFERELPSVRGR
jgi:hypothetical protein